MDKYKIYEILHKSFGLQKFLSQLNDFFQKNDEEINFYYNKLKSYGGQYPKESNGKNQLFLKNGEDFLYISNDENTIQLKFEYLKRIEIHKKDNIKEYLWSFNNRYSMFILKKTLDNPSIKTSDEEYYSLNASPDFEKTFEISIDKIIYDHNSFEEKKLNEIYQLFHSNQFKSYNQYLIEIFPEYEGMTEFKKTKIKYSIDYMDRLSECNYYFYNNKIGLTVYFLKNIKDYSSIFKEKSLYIDVNFIFTVTNINRLRNYFYYFVSIFKDENEDYLYLCSNIKNLIQPSKEKDDILKEIIYLLGNNYIILFDNIYTEQQFNRIQNILNYEMYQKFKIKNLFYIQFNSSTINLFQFYYQYLEFISFNDIESINVLDDFSVVDIDNYENNIKKEFQEIENLNYNLITFLKIKYYISNTFIPIYLVNLFTLQFFYKFIILQLNLKKKIKIRFRNNIIKNVAQTFFEKYYIEYINKNIDELHKIISNSQEGGFLEKNIILDLITDVNKNYLLKIEIDSIYCFKNFNETNIDNIKNKSNMVFIQTTDNAPKYDFSLLYSYIEENNNKSIYLDSYQVGIKKTNDDLNKLDSNIILFDLSYFAYKIKILTGKKIDKISFNIITISKTQNDIQFENMKQFCKNKSYNFLIYDPKESLFYTFDNNNEIKKIENIVNPKLSYYSPINIFKDNLQFDEIPNKYPIEKDKEKKLPKQVCEILQKVEINVKASMLIAKFNVNMLKYLDFFVSFNNYVLYFKLEKEEYFIYEKNIYSVTEKKIITLNMNQNLSFNLYIYLIIIDSYQNPLFSVSAKNKYIGKKIKSNN